MSRTDHDDHGNLRSWQPPEPAKRPDGMSFAEFHMGKPYNAPAYNVAGHVCPATGRIAMTVADAWAREDSADRMFCTYSEGAAALGLEPWRLLDGLDAVAALDADGNPTAYDLHFAAGSPQSVKPDHIVYMQRTKAERAEAVTLSPTVDDALRMALVAAPLRREEPRLYAVDLMRLVPVGAALHPTRITMDSIAAPDHEAAAAAALGLMAVPSEWIAVRASSSFA